MHAITMQEADLVGGGGSFADAIGIGSGSGAVGGGIAAELAGGGIAAIGEGAAYGGVVGAAAVIAFGGGFWVGTMLQHAVENMLD
jgi:hypothetical protein